MKEDMAPPNHFTCHSKFHRGPDPHLSECIRLMMMQPEEFRLFAMSREQKTITASAPSIPRGKASGRGRRHPGGGELGSNPPLGVLPTPPTPSEAAAVLGAYMRLVGIMIARYKGSLEDDLGLISGDVKVKRPASRKKVRFEDLPARMQAAVVARVDEKACWALLKVRMAI